MATMVLLAWRLRERQTGQPDRQTNKQTAKTERLLRKLSSAYAVYGTSLVDIYLFIKKQREWVSRMRTLHGFKKLSGFRDPILRVLAGCGLCVTEPIVK